MRRTSTRAALSDNQRLYEGAPIVTSAAVLPQVAHLDPRNHQIFTFSDCVGALGADLQALNAASGSEHEYLQ